MSGKLLIAGFVMVLVGCIAILRALDSGSTPASAGASAAAHEPAAPAEPVASAPAAAAPTPVDAAAPSPSAPARATPVPSIAASVAPPPADEEIPLRPDGRIMAVADLDVLREAAPPTDDLVRACIAKHGGASVTGTLITTYVVARKRDASGAFVVETETTGYEEEGSTITDPELIQCLHETAYKMKFPPSRSPVATWVRRRIVVEKGILAENWVFKHGYIR